MTLTAGDREPTRREVVRHAVTSGGALVVGAWAAPTILETLPAAALGSPPPTTEPSPSTTQAPPTTAPPTTTAPPPTTEPPVGKSARAITQDGSDRGVSSIGAGDESGATDSASGKRSGAEQIALSGADIDKLLEVARALVGGGGALLLGERATRGDEPT